MLIVALFMPSTHYAGKNLTSVHPANWIAYAKTLGMALVAVSFTYGGYQQTINFGSEVEKPSKNIPKGIFFGITIIILLYLLVNFSYYKVLGFDDLKAKNEIAKVVATKLFGETGGNVFSGLLFLSVLAYVNALMMSNPRVMFAMSEDGVLPAAFKKKTDKKQVLVVSLTAFAVTCIVILFFANTFDKILGFTIFLDSFGMATSAGAIFMLRKKTKHLDDKDIYIMKWYPLIPIVFISAYIFVALSIAVDQPKIALTGIAVLAAFMVIYFITAKQRSVSK
jgi:APA family basic amino acid/polyamine antiporter